MTAATSWPWRCGYCYENAGSRLEDLAEHLLDEHGTGAAALLHPDDTPTGRRVPVVVAVLGLLAVAVLLAYGGVIILMSDRCI